jgi:hypothetical protein
MCKCAESAIEDDQRGNENHFEDGRICRQRRMERKSLVETAFEVVNKRTSLISRNKVIAYGFALYYNASARSTGEETTRTSGDRIYYSGP